MNTSHAPPLAPTTRLRWVRRSVDTKTKAVQVLQQWFAPDVPAYMVDKRAGEWRDVIEVAE